MHSYALQTSRGDLKDIVGKGFPRGLTLDVHCDTLTVSLLQGHNQTRQVPFTVSGLTYSWLLLIKSKPRFYPSSSSLPPLQQGSISLSSHIPLGI